jgi:hypothetical protein
MALNSLNSLNKLNGLNSLGGSGSGSANNLTPDELLMIAKSRGGAVGQVAEELVHPERSILSTIGGGFKKAFKGFVDVISLPSEILAGAISSKYTVGEAIDQNKRVTDAIFGDKNIFNKEGEATTLQKVGNFIVRTPIDILTDPLTYLTFGASAGVLGLKSLPKISLGLKAIEEAGLAAKAAKSGGVVSKALSAEGADLLKFAKNIQRQTAGTMSAENLKSLVKAEEGLRKGLLAKGVTQETIDFTEKELKDLLKATVEAPLQPDWAKKAVSNLLDHNPALTKTMLDEGGIKFFGKTVLSGQRISATMEMIPGMTLLDNFTKPMRNSVNGLFDPAMVKANGEYVRLPEEYVGFRQQLKDLGESLHVDAFRNMSNIQKQLNLNKDEWRLVMDAMSIRKMPADPRLAKAYETMLDLDEANLEMLKKAGVPIHNLENHTGLIFVPEDTRRVVKNSQFSKDVGAAQEAAHAKFIEQKGFTLDERIPEAFKYADEFPDSEIGKALKKVDGEVVQSPQEIGFAIGRELDQKVKTIMKDGVTTLEEALKKPEIAKLQELRDAVDKLVPNKELIGKAEKLGLTKNEQGFFIDENANIFKRVAASATELERAGFTNFDTNLLTAYTTRTLQNQRQAIGQHFMEGLIRNFSKKIDEAPKSWLPIDNAGMFQKGIDIGIPLVSKDGAEYVFHPAIAKAYETMLQGITKDEISQGFWSGFDKLQRYWKASVTSIFPMFHGRNAISNVFLNMMDMGVEVFNPKTHVMSMDFIYKDRVANNLAKRMIGTGDDAVKASKEFTELMQKNMFTDKTGYTWTYGEIRKAIKDNNVAFTPNITGATDVGDKESLAKFFGLDQSKTKQNLQKLNPFNAEQNAVIRGGREVGRAIEEQARLTNFIANLTKTGDVTHAAQRSKQFLFDYGNLTSFEKNVLRRLIPFYAFTKFNLQLQAKTLLTTPGRIGAELKIINSIAEVMGGEQLTEKEKSLLPSWMANSISLKRGEEIISGFGTPIEQPFQQFQPNSLLGSISPLFRYPVEAMTGYQFFRGKPTSEVIDAKNFKEAPQAIKNFIGYSEYKGVTKDGKTYNRSISLRPGNMNFFNNLPWAGRISTILGNMTDEKISDQAKALTLITGIQARSADFQQLESQQEELLRTQLEKILYNSGVRGAFTRNYTRTNTQPVE